MASATRTFTGETDGDYKGTATNWYADTEPVANDYVRIALENENDIDGADYTALSMLTWLIENNMPKLVGTLAAPLQIDGVAVTVEGTGAQHLYFKDATSIRVFQAASTSSDNEYGLNLTGVENEDILIRTASGGKVAIGWRGVAAEYKDIILERGTLYLGEGVIANGDTKITTVKVEGGKLITYAAIATATYTGSASVDVEGGAYSTALYGLEGARINVNGGGTITLLDLDDEATLDFDGGYLLPITVTNCNVRSKGVDIIDTHNRVTWTNAVVDLGDRYGFGAGSTLTIG